MLLNGFLNHMSSEASLARLNVATHGMQLTLCSHHNYCQLSVASQTVSCVTFGTTQGHAGLAQCPGTYTWQR